MGRETKKWEVKTEFETEKTNDEQFRSAILSPTDRPVVMVPLLSARHGPAPRSVPPNLAHNASKQTALSLMGTGEWETARGDEIDDGRVRRRRLQPPPSPPLSFALSSLLL
ncbi:hypothetical protein niasHS_007383 [Heterodera schachtii]|uniref:Uncharacterized protein n=1 Tax=Heterodera schachtii TaxID=97005 RepID=A0ABD2JXI6_HETSC